jgi:hypothetical protein
MVAYRLLRADVIAEATWRQVADRFRQEWLANHAKQDDADTGGDSGGPSYYVVKRHRLGDALLDTVRRSLGEGTLTHTKAAQVLGVKARNVDPLLFGNPAQGSR